MTDDERRLAAAVGVALGRQLYERVPVERLPGGAWAGAGEWDRFAAQIRELVEADVLRDIYVRSDKMDVEIVLVLSFDGERLDPATAERELEWLWNGIRRLHRLAPSGGYEAAMADLADAAGAVDEHAGALVRFAKSAGAFGRTITGVAIYCCLDGITPDMADAADDLGRWEIGPFLNPANHRIDGVIVDDKEGEILGTTGRRSLDLDQLVGDLSHELAR